LNLGSCFGLFVSALKILFPGNGDFGSKRHGSNAWIIELEGREVVLVGLFHRQVGELRSSAVGGD
jgi:hypothetical protein